eukprot:GFUD01137384.1.p1 GENE.GFUD01137384.1~~GFUD01137384.1.p1  ORF type:complete len:357 (+),score=87.36 GFUD01137384.1:144-1214(+)
MGTTEKFCLRWNDFENNISVAFREIREEKDFFDCTLSCGSRQIQAHKLILSACSPFFRSVLKQNPHQHPLLYLKGVEFNDLQAVLNFMYHGEVNVAQEELNSFLSVAEDLKVKGLTQNNSTETQSSKPKSNSEPVPSFNKPSVPKPVEDQAHRPPTLSVPKQRQRPVVAPPLPTAHFQDHHDDDIQEVLPVVKQEPAAAEHMAPSLPVTTMTQHHYQDPVDNQQGTTVASMEESYCDDGYDDYGGYEGEGYGEEGTLMTSGPGADQNKGYNVANYDEAGTEQKMNVDEFILSVDGKNHCSICAKEFSQKRVCKRHILTVHFGDQEQNCHLCMKMFKNKPSLRSHMRSNHGIYTSRK